MKPNRLLRCILILGETHFVGKELVVELLENNPIIECWLFDSTLFNHVPTHFHNRLHLLEVLNTEMLFKAWEVNQWDTVLHIVSDYSENASSYKTQLRYQKGLLGTVLQKVVRETKLHPLYVEIDTDWVFGEQEETVCESLSEESINYLDSYVHRIVVDATNILAMDMQLNHWIFNFITALESNSKFGVPYEGTILRDWIAMKDYIHAVCTILIRGKIGEQYTVVGFNEWTNYDLMLLIGATYDRLNAKKNGEFKSQQQNEKLGCRNSYKEVKIGISFLDLRGEYAPRSMYDIIEYFVKTSLPLVTKG